MEEKKLLLHTETAIDSCHRLRDYDGKCKNLHGHTWFVEVWVKGYAKDLDAVGILYDFGNVKSIKEKYDHLLLNDIPPFDKVNPTAENITMNIYSELKKEKPILEFKVRVYETKVGKDTYCEYGDWE